MTTQSTILGLAIGDGLEGIPHNKRSHSSYDSASESYVKQVEDSEVLQELDKTIYDLS